MQPGYAIKPKPGMKKRQPSMNSVKQISSGSMIMHFLQQSKKKNNTDHGMNGHKNSSLEILMLLLDSKKAIKSLFPA